MQVLALGDEERVRQSVRLPLRIRGWRDTEQYLAICFQKSGIPVSYRDIRPRIHPAYSLPTARQP